MYGNTIYVKNVNEALPLGLYLMQSFGKRTESRAGPVLRVPGPVCTVYKYPRERVLFGAVRDANPFFHLFDALWMLSGSKTVNMPALFLPRIIDFSDDGRVFHGSYGYRLRYASGFDQLQRVCDLLSSNPGTRQAVLSIWNPVLDLGAVTKDMPCNDMVMLDIVDGELNMTVCNRSNDVIWGAYGANAVQFSVLQEYLAIMLGVDPGKYAQMSNNYHVYEDNAYWKQWVAGNRDATHVSSPYDYADTHLKLAADHDDARALFRDCIRFSHAADVGANHGMFPRNDLKYESSFFEHVAWPMADAFYEYKVHRDWESAMERCAGILAWDWRRACTEWLHRRAEKAGVSL